MIYLFWLETFAFGPFCGLDKTVPSSSDLGSENSFQRAQTWPRMDLLVICSVNTCTFSFLYCVILMANGQS